MSKAYKCNGCGEDETPKAVLTVLFKKKKSNKMLSTVKSENRKFSIVCTKILLVILKDRNTLNIYNLNSSRVMESPVLQSCLRFQRKTKMRIDCQ